MLVFFTKWVSFDVLQSRANIITKWEAFLYYRSGKWYYKVL